MLNYFYIQYRYAHSHTISPPALTGQKDSPKNLVHNDLKTCLSENVCRISGFIFTRGDLKEHEV